MEEHLVGVKNSLGGGERVGRVVLMYAGKVSMQQGEDEEMGD